MIPAQGDTQAPSRVMICRALRGITMANRIENTRAGSEPLRLSNGATDVLLSILLLAGSDLATSDWEKSLVVWLAEHDQSVVGGGCVDFDLDEIAWTSTDFQH